MVSVVVCTYNREKYIGTCLTLLAEQTENSAAYEVLVVDNMSTDNSREIIERVIAQYPNRPLRYFIEKNQGHTYARNRGVREAKGEYISFLDDDAFVKPDYIKQLAEHFTSNSSVMAIGGKIIPQYEGEEPEWMSKYLLTLVSALDMGNETKEFPKNKFPIGANMAFRKQVFDQYGLFNTDLGRRADGLEGGDEKELFMRLRKGNALIHYVPAVAVSHIIPEKRIQIAYIKGLGIGVGSSEMKRLKNAGLGKKLNKYASEVVKWLASFYLFLSYSLRGKFKAAIMFLRFRFWVLQGMLN